MNEEQLKGLPIKWINTPLSYARLTTQYNLFQQSVLLKVSEYLQKYIEIYYGSDLSKSKDVPRPLFTEEQKQMGLGKIYVSYAELGVSANNFPQVREEARQCLEKMVVHGPIVMKNGKPTQSLYPVFTEVSVDQDASTCTFELNTKIVEQGLSVLDYTFDMSKKYVKHPDNIAIIGKVEKMPGLYFLLRDTMQSWKFKKAKLTVKDIKEFLNMVEKDENGMIVKNMYPKFSQFKKHVLEPALADIKRLKDIGQIDESFDMELVYKGKRQVGDPAFIIFSIVDEKKKKNTQLDMFAEAEEVTEPKPQRPPMQVEEGRALWMEALLELGKDSEYASWCADNVVCHGLRDRKLVLESDAADEFRQGSQFKELDALMRKKLDKGQRAPWFTFTA